MRIVDEITAVEREHSLGIQPLAVSERDPLRHLLRSQYGATGNRMWETLSDCAAIHDREGWQWIGRFVGARECILLFDANEEPEMFRVPSGSALDSLLQNSNGFEFYVTEVGATYLVCFNHHDVLVCCGSAQAWLETRDPAA